MNAEVRNAIRQIRERYDDKTLLWSGNQFSNALSDMLGEDARQLCIQVQLALSAGVGRMYQEQGAAPDAAFYERVQNVMEGCGLSRQAAADLLEVFNEAAGWPGPAGEKMPEKPEWISLGQPDSAAMSPQEASPQVAAPQGTSPQVASPQVAQAPAAVFSVKKALAAAILPLVMVLLYAALDRFFLHWAYPFENFVTDTKSGITIARLINHRYWYRYLGTLLLPQLMAVLSVLAAWLIFRRKGDPFAHCYRAGSLMGLAGCLGALNLSGFFAEIFMMLHGATFHFSAFNLWMLGIAVTLRLQFYLPYNVLNFWLSIVFLAISVLSVILGIVMAKKRARRGNGAR